MNCKYVQTEKSELHSSSSEPLTCMFLTNDPNCSFNLQDSFKFAFKLENKLSFNDIVARAMAETSEVEYHSLSSSFTRSPIRLSSGITSPKAVARVVRKYQIHTKTYSPKWELDPNYRGWVQRSQRGDGFFYCLACSKDYTCGKSELDKHASSKKHCINLKTMIASGSQMEATHIVKTDDSESVENMFLDDMNSSSTSFVIDEDSSHREEETFGKYIVSELKRIKKKKTYELVKWEILQALQKAILEEVETES